MPQAMVMELMPVRTARDDPQIIVMMVRTMATSEEDLMTTVTRISVILSDSRRAPRNKIRTWATNELWRQFYLQGKSR